MSTQDGRSGPGGDLFGSALEETRQRLARGEALERCLADYPPELRGDLAALAPVAARVGGLAHDPSPDFVKRLEARLLDEAERTSRDGVPPRRGWLSLLAPRMSLGSAIVVLFVVLLTLGGGAGLITASAASLPDSPLYQVKSAGEWAQLKLARTPDAQVDVYGQQLSERGKELAQAIRVGRASRVVEALASRVDTTTTKMVDRALEARARGNQRPALRALVTVRATERRVAAALQSVEPAARPPLQWLQGRLADQERRLLEASAGQVRAQP